MTQQPRYGSLKRSKVLKLLFILSVAALFIYPLVALVVLSADDNRIHFGVSALIISAMHLAVVRGLIRGREFSNQTLWRSTLLSSGFYYFCYLLAHLLISGFSEPISVISTASVWFIPSGILPVVLLSTTGISGYWLLNKRNLSTHME